MMTNINKCVQKKFLIDGLIGVQVSSIINEVIRAISYFFKEKSWSIKNAKHAKTNQQNKNKRIKNNKKQIFFVHKIFYEGKIACFAFFMLQVFS